MRSTKEKAPIAFFAYNRPKHTRTALESLAQNYASKSSELFVFCDGPKFESDRGAVDEVRDIVRSQQWCGTVHVVENEGNLGLANSIITGVTRLCDEFGRVIVLEDDLILSPYFLDYINSALDLYEEDSRVMQVSGFMYPVNDDQLDETFFLPFISSWGWGTWKSAWRLFDPDVKQFHSLASSPKKIFRFNIDGSYPYFPMLVKQLDGKIDSWAIRWNFSVFMEDGLVLYPRNTLVQNAGFDGSGTNCNKSDKPLDEMNEKSIDVSIIENRVVSDIAFNKIKKYLSKESRQNNVSSTSLIYKIKNYIIRYYSKR